MMEKGPNRATEAPIGISAPLSTVYVFGASYLGRSAQNLPWSNLDVVIWIS
jgi:hypothetical protein